MCVCVCVCVQEVSVMRALGGQNVEYDFRISSANKRGGVSTESTETTESLQLFFGEQHSSH